MTRLPAKLDRRPTAIRVILLFYALALVLATQLSGFQFDRPVALVIQIDKVLYFLAYAVLMGLAVHAKLVGWQRSGYINRLVAGAAVLVLAMVDHSTRAWLSPDVQQADLFARVLGILSVYLVLASPTGLTRWPVHVTTAARVIWLPLAPTVMLLVTMPSASRLIGFAPAAFNYRGADKAGHFYLAMMMTWLLAIAAPATRLKPRLSAAVTIGLMLLSAPLIEFVQSYTGRGVEMADVAAHNRGVLVALIVWASFGLIVAPFWNRWLDRRGVAKLPVKVKPSVLTLQELPRFAEGAARISLLTLASRLSTLLRDATLAAALGVSLVADAFAVSFAIPNFLLRLIDDGVFASVLTPHYSDLLKRDPAQARRFASLCVALLLVGLSAITLMGHGLLGWFIASGGGSQRGVLVIRLGMMMLPYLPMVCLVALLGSVLQIHRKFGPAANASIILNLTLIAMTAWTIASFHSSRDETHPLSVAFIVAGAMLIAGWIQVGYLMIVTQHVAPLGLHFHNAWTPLKHMLRTIIPRVLGLAVFPIHAMLDMATAMGLTPGDAALPGADVLDQSQLHFLGLAINYPLNVGDVASLHWAQQLFQFPLGIFGLAVATSIASTFLITPQNKTSADDLAPKLRHGLRLIVFIGLPVSVAMWLVSELLVRVVYQRFAMDFYEAQRVARIFASYAPAIWAYALVYLLTRAFHARENLATPAKVSVLMIALNITLNMTFVWQDGAQGLAWSTSILVMLQTLVLLAIIRRHVPGLVDRSVIRSWLRTLWLTALMAITLWLASQLVEVTGLSLAGTLAILGAMFTVAVAIILGGAKLMGGEAFR